MRPQVQWRNGLSARMTARASPVVSQIRMVPSLLVVVSRVPSGAIATAFTRPSWPVRTWRDWPVPASQVRMVPFLLAVGHSKLSR